MEYINYSRSDVGSPRTASTNIKNVRTEIGLKFNRKAGQSERTFSGLGSYLKVDVENEGTTEMVNIPFFSAQQQDKFVNINGINFVNPLVKKIIEKVTKRNIPAFSLDDFKVEHEAELQSLINATTVDAEKVLLEQKKAVIHNARKKDSYNLIKERIQYLTDSICTMEKDGLNLTSCTNDTARKRAITSYCDEYTSRLIELVTLKSQLKRLTWKEKKGFQKFMNKRFIAGSVATLLVASGVAASRLFYFPKWLWAHADSSKKPNVIATQEMPKATLETTRTPVLEPTFKPDSQKEEVLLSASNKYSLDSEMFQISKQANYSNFASLEGNIKNILEAYGFNYDKIINSYTIIEHMHELDTSKMSSFEINEHIANVRTLISIIYNFNYYQVLPLRTETLNAMQASLNGNVEAGANFVANANESGEPLIDMLAVGELMAQIISNESLLSFNTNIYEREINEYKTKILNGSLKVVSLEPSKVKTLGIYSRI